MKYSKLIILMMMSVLFTQASVQIVHNSASPTVDVYVDGALAVPDLNTELQLVC